MTTAIPPPDRGTRSRDTVLLASRLPCVHRIRRYRRAVQVMQRHDHSSPSIDGGFKTAGDIPTVEVASLVPAEV